MDYTKSSRLLKKKRETIKLNNRGKDTRKKPYNLPNLKVKTHDKKVVKFNEDNLIQLLEYFKATWVKVLHQVSNNLELYLLLRKIMERVVGVNLPLSIESKEGINIINKYITETFTSNQITNGGKTSKYKSRKIKGGMNLKIIIGCILGLITFLSLTTNAQVNVQPDVLMHYVGNILPQTAALVASTNLYGTCIMIAGMWVDCLYRNNNLYNNQSHIEQWATGEYNKQRKHFYRNKDFNFPTGISSFVPSGDEHKKRVYTPSPSSSLMDKPEERNRNFENQLLINNAMYPMFSLPEKERGLFFSIASLNWVGNDIGHEIIIIGKTTELHDKYSSHRYSPHTIKYCIIDPARFTPFIYNKIAGVKSSELKIPGICNPGLFTEEQLNKMGNIFHLTDDIPGELDKIYAKTTVLSRVARRDVDVQMLPITEFTGDPKGNDLLDYMDIMTNTILGTYLQLRNEELIYRLTEHNEGYDAEQKELTHEYTRPERVATKFIEGIKAEREQLRDEKLGTNYQTGLQILDESPKAPSGTEFLLENEYNKPSTHTDSPPPAQRQHPQPNADTDTNIHTDPPPPPLPITKQALTQP